jgi:4-amino-4-deoxy-L-arabinose transferase-like glycosyltransferase/sugar lactone lactonase YvrE
MNRIGIRPVLLGLGALLLALAGQRALAASGVWNAGLLLIAGAVGFVASFWRGQFDPIRPITVRVPGEGWLPAVRDSWGVRTGAGLLVVALLLTFSAVQQFHEFEPFAGHAWIWLGAALAAALVGAALLDHGLKLSPENLPERSEFPGRPDSQPITASTLRRAVEIALWLATILALAALFRLWRFSDLPFGVWYDEAEHGLQALRILESEQFRPIFEGAITGPAHYLYLVAGAFARFGVSVQSIRLVSVAFGLLAVVAGYLVGAELFGRRLGAVAAALLAVSSWAVTLSRFGMYSTMSTPLFALLTAAFLLRGLRTRRLLDYALAGVALGLGLSFYTSFRLFVPAVALFLLYLVLHTWATRRAWPPAAFWLGVAVLLFLAALVVSPLAVYAVKHPEIFWARVEDTFIFARKGATERWPALWENLRRHLLMFNVFGDPNGRHNLPGNPMLDPVTGALFVAGVAYALRFVLKPAYLFLLAWLVFGLMGGVLSLDFEAPQSLRANATLPVAYLLATIPLAVLARAWTLAAGRYYPHALRWSAVALLAGIAGLNAHTYFVRQANDFAVWNAYSTPETLAARLLAEIDPTTDAYVTAFFHGHPTIKFVARNAPAYTELDTLDQFPLDFVPGRSALLMLNADSRALYDEARLLYPTAAFTETLPPVDGPPVLFTVRLTPEDVASIRGVTARYYANDAWLGEPVITRVEDQLVADWTQGAPLPFPFSVEWEGILHAPLSGQYEFYLETPAAAEVWIGERSVLTGTGVLAGALPLAEGNHTLRLAAVGAPGRLALAWRTPDGPVEPIPPAQLYHASRLAHGLLGRYFSNGAWQAPEAFSRIDSRFNRYIHVTPLPRPYTVEWVGKLAAPVDGLYRFGLESIDESELWIDETPVVRADQPNALSEGEITLTPGLHDIRIRLADRTDHTHINVFWQPPGSERQIIPTEALFPPQESYARVTLPTLDALTQMPVAEAGGAGGASVLAGEVREVVGGLAAPRGVAVGDDGAIYVTESGTQRVMVFTPDGQQQRVIDGGAVRLVEPSDVAVNGERIFVLDAGESAVRVFMPDGAPSSFAEGLDAAFTDRSRGISAGPEGGVLIANTPNNRIVGLDAAGAVAAQIVVWPGEAAQPVDVVMGENGRIFVADGQGQRLIRYAPGKQIERAWSLTPANTVDSPHLARDAAGRLYVTEPEAGRVLLRDVDGEALGAWDLNVLLGRPVRPVGIAVAPDGVIWVVDSAGGALIALTPLQ